MSLLVRFNTERKIPSYCKNIFQKICKKPLKINEKRHSRLRVSRSAIGIRPVNKSATPCGACAFDRSVNRQLPILPARHQASTFGLWMLNYCVRYGNRWNHPGIITGYIERTSVLSKLYRRKKYILDSCIKERKIASRFCVSDSHAYCISDSHSFVPKLALCLNFARRYAPSKLALCLR